MSQKVVILTTVHPVAEPDSDIDVCIELDDFKKFRCSYNPCDG